MFKFLACQTCHYGPNGPMTCGERADGCFPQSELPERMRNDTPEMPFRYRRTIEDAKSQDLEDIFTGEAIGRTLTEMRDEDRLQEDLAFEAHEDALELAALGEPECDHDWIEVNDTTQVCAICNKERFSEYFSG